MGIFRDHLTDYDENFMNETYEDFLKAIKDILTDMSIDEVDEFGSFLAIEFFDVSEDEVQEVEFDEENVIEMIIDLGEENYEMILELLLPDETEYSDDNEHFESEDYDDMDVSEGVAKVMKTKNLNKKKRKFFKKSLATLRKQKAERKKHARLTRASRRTYQRINKEKIKQYQKSRKTFISKGRHFVKVRRKGGGEA